jgi:misacylated tRNA(Ala) deacylase
MPDDLPATELLYATDAYRREFDSPVVGVDEPAHAVALEATTFFSTGGGQPHDTGTLRLPSGAAAVTEVRTATALSGTRSPTTSRSPTSGRRSTACSTGSAVTC